MGELTHKALIKAEMLRIEDILKKMDTVLDAPFIVYAWAHEIIGHADRIMKVCEPQISDEGKARVKAHEV